MQLVVCEENIVIEGSYESLESLRGACIVCNRLSIVTKCVVSNCIACLNANNVIELVNVCADGIGLAICDSDGLAAEGNGDISTGLVLDNECGNGGQVYTDLNACRNSVSRNGGSGDLGSDVSILLNRPARMVSSTPKYTHASARYSAIT